MGAIGSVENAVSTQVQRSLLSYSNQNTPISEPVLAQRDDDAIRRLEDLCFEYKPVMVDEKPVFNKKDELIYQRALKYPDIYALLSSIGHLEGTTGLTWETSRALFLIWEGRQFNPLWHKRYKRNREAKNILRQIYGIKERQLVGDSYHGFRAEHVENVSGSIRRFEMRDNMVNNGRFPV